MITKDIIETITTIALQESSTRRTLSEAADGVTKSKVAVQYVVAKFNYDKALHDPQRSRSTNDSDSGASARTVSSLEAKYKAVAAQLRPTFGAQVTRVAAMLQDLEDDLYMGRPIKERDAQFKKVRQSAGFDEATWQKGMAAEFDIYKPLASVGAKAVKLSDTEARAVWTGGIEMVKALKVLQANPKKVGSLENADLMRFRAIAKMLAQLGLAD